MGGGLWGIGFLVVNFRIAKLLKRFVATPMPRRDFLLALLGARLTFVIPDLTVLLLLGTLMFQMPIRGNLALVIAIDMLGALAFAGIGLLVGSRATTTETVSGLMNLVMLPMWLFSGVFFASGRFPRRIPALHQRASPHSARERPASGDSRRGRPLRRAERPADPRRLGHRDVRARLALLPVDLIAPRTADA